MYRALGRGLLVGVVWGLLARAFMRLLATNPEFSWAGTASIVGLSAVLWGGWWVTAQARRERRSAWWRLVGVPGLLLFASPGMILLPGAVGTALAIRFWGSQSLRARTVGVVALVAGLAASVLGARPGLEGADAPPAAWAGLGLLVVATVWLGFGLHMWLRPRPTSRATTRGEPRRTASSAAYDLG
jgi:hypothetical protein